MNDTQYHDLLIRIDTRQSVMSEQIRCIKVQLEGRQCQAHTEKIKTLEKITWGAVMASIAAMASAAWQAIIK